MDTQHDTQHNTQPNRAPTEKPVEGLFQKGSMQVGIMAGVVTAVSQPFAQVKMQTLLGLSPSVPLLIAIAVSVLLAAHHVFAVQRVKVLEGLVLMPLVALIVFSSYCGTNQFLASEAAPSTDQARFTNLEAQLKVQKAVNDELIKALGVVPEETAHKQSPPLPQTRNGWSGALDKLLSALVPPAYGQDDKARRAQDEEKRRLAVLLRESREKQEKLEQERRRLEAQGGKSQKPPLLKSW